MKDRKAASRRDVVKRAILSAALISAGVSFAAITGPDGRDYEQIVVASDAPNSVKLAASELKRFLGGIGVADLPVVHVADNGKAAVFIGGDPETAKLPSDGFVIRTEPGRLTIAGKDNPGRFSEFPGRNPFRWIELYNSRLKLAALLDQGTLCGVYAFLEDACGVRFYWPGADGTVVPRRKSMRLPELSIRRAPRFNYRYPWFCNFSKDEDCPLWFRRVGFGGQAPVVIIDSFIMVNHMKKDHPEYFALVDGVRDFSNKCASQGGGHLCLTNPDVAKAWARQIDEFFETHPEMEVYPVTPGDGLMRVCGCPACQAEVRPAAGRKGKFSYHIWKFVNSVAREVAKKHPGKFIGCLAYESYWSPPEELTFEPNTAVMICQSRRGMCNEDARAAFWDGVERWSKLVGRVYFWNWYLTNWPPNDHLPVFYPNVISSEIRKMAANPKVFGEFIEAENFAGMFPFGTDRMGTPGMSHLNLYLTAKLYWNPQLDVDATLDEYYRLFYGPAEKEMRAFWETAARCVEGAGPKGSKVSPNAIFTQEVLRKLGACLDAAASAVPADSAFARRIAVVAGEFRRGAGRLLRMQKAAAQTLDVRPVESPADVGKLQPVRFTNADAAPGEPPTWLYAGYDRRSLHLKFICHEPDMKSLASKFNVHDDARMWEDDCIEVFLSPQPDNPCKCFQLIVDVGGELWDARWENANRHDIGWESGANVRIDKKPNRWIADVSIPFDAIGINDVNFAGDVVANFFRTRAVSKPPQTFVWSPTGTARHFEPKRFGRLRFHQPRVK